MLVKFTPKRD